MFPPRRMSKAVYEIYPGFDKLTLTNRFNLNYNIFMGAVVAGI